MIAFSGIVEGKVTGNKLAEILAFIVLVFVFAANWCVMSMKTCAMMKLKAKKCKSVRGDVHCMR